MDIIFHACSSASVVMLEVETHCRCVEPPLLVLLIDDVLCCVYWLFHFGHFAFKVFVNLHHLPNIDQFFLHYLDLLHILILLLTLIEILSLISIDSFQSSINDMFGLCLKYTLKEFNENKFFVHLFFCHFTSIGMIFHIYAASIFLSFELSQHIFETGKVQVDVFVSVNAQGIIFVFGLSFDKIHNGLPAICNQSFNPIGCLLFLLTLFFLFLINNYGQVQVRVHENIDLLFIFIASKHQIVGFDEKERKFAILFEIKLTPSLFFKHQFYLPFILQPLFLVSLFGDCDVHLNQINQCIKSMEKTKSKL